MSMIVIFRFRLIYKPLPLLTPSHGTTTDILHLQTSFSTRNVDYTSSDLIINTKLSCLPLRKYLGEKVNFLGGKFTSEKLT